MQWDVEIVVVVVVGEAAQDEIDIVDIEVDIVETDSDIVEDEVVVGEAYQFPIQKFLCHI